MALDTRVVLVVGYDHTTFSPFVLSTTQRVLTIGLSSDLNSFVLLRLWDVWTDHVPLKLLR